MRRGLQITIIVLFLKNGSLTDMTKEPFFIKRNHW